MAFPSPSTVTGDKTHIGSSGDVGLAIDRFPIGQLKEGDRSPLSAPASAGLRSAIDGQKS
jgi:hypothetical protein